MTTFQIDQATLLDALNDTAIAASGADVTLPMLRAVHLVGNKGSRKVTLTASDRYILVRRTLELPEPLSGRVEELIPLDGVKTLASVLKATLSRYGRQQALVEVGSSQMIVNGTAVTVETDPRIFPTLQPLLDKAAAADATVDQLPVDLTLLVRVSKLTAAKPVRRGKAPAARIFFTPNGTTGRPGLLSVRFPDESTTVLVMPARVE